MDAKIDYLSIALPVDLSGAGETETVMSYLVSALRRYVPSFADVYAPSLNWNPSGPRGRYGRSFDDTTHHARVWYGGVATNVLIELPGMACQHARDLRILDLLLFQARDRVTRIDLAVDLDGDVPPGSFVDAGHNRRFAAGGSYWSAQGETRYVGSMKSERFARVYRYAPPHPRAGVTRVEHVLRSHYAKSAANLIGTHGLQHATAAAGASFGWKSSAWQLSALKVDRLRSKKTDRGNESRVRWLEGTVKPALLRAAREGLIDLEVWIAELSNFNLSAVPQPQPQKRIKRSAG